MRHEGIPAGAVKSLAEPSAACFKDEEIAQHLEGKLPSARSRQLLDHADRCTSCRVLLSTLARRPTSDPAHVTLVEEASAPREVTATGLGQERLQPGEQVGRYVVIDLLGQGGMGQVYRARDSQLYRPVALKILRATTNEKKRKRAQPRLLREAQAMAQLSHPNVLAVHDVGISNHRVFLAMEYVDGGTLAESMVKSPRFSAVMLRYFLEAGRGLAAAHAAGMVHRDFKPSNVLIGRDGWVRVTDFGLAQLFPTSDVPAVEGPENPFVAAHGALTNAGEVVGTPGYMAPEQLRGQGADARSDQFSFCVSLYEAITGVRPFKGRNRAELLMAMRRGIPEPKRWMRHRRLINALRKGLSTSPEDRYDDMEALLGALASANLAERLTPWALTGGCALLVAGAFLLATVPLRRTRPPTAPPPAVVTAPVSQAQWEQSTRSPAALFATARAFQRAGYAAQAITYYRRYLEADPSGPGAAEATDQLQRLRAQVEKTATARKVGRPRPR